MDRTKKFVVALGLFAIAASGCKSCGDEPGENNETNNATTNNTSTNNASNNSGTNNTTVVVECTSSEPLEVPTSGDVTITKGEDGVCYSSGDITVRDGIMTIEAGVVIEFEENAVVRVEPTGKINMVGTEAAPIIFKGERDIPGYWGGVVIDRSNSLDNIIDWVVIQYAGRDQEAALTYTACCAADTRLEISNSIFEFSATLGFFADTDTSLAKFENNTMRNNVGGAAFIHAETISDIGEGNVFSGNDVDVVFTEGAVDDAGTHVWPALDVPYQVREDILISAGSGVTIGAGATFQFEEGFGIDVQIDSPFAIMGEAGNEVLLTGTEKVRGHWKGLDFDRLNFDENMIAYATIEYAGRDAEGAVYFRACCADPGLMSFSNTTIKESASFGLVLDGPMITMPTFENVTLTANTLGAMRTPAENVAQIVTGDFTGNDVDIVEITGGQVTPAGTTWANPGVPYRVTDDISVESMATLTLTAGTNFEFDTGTVFKLRVASGLSAVGTAADPIVFRGITDGPGIWEGISMDRAEWADNELDFVEIANAGANTSEAALSITSCCGDTTSFTLNNLTIRNSSKPALQVPTSNYTFTGCANLTFTDTMGEVIDASGTPLTIAEFQALCL